jgi:hypothetical protein
MMDLKEIELKDVDCIHVTEDTDQWWAFVDTGMILWDP